MTERTRALTVLVAVFLVGVIVGTAGYYLWSLRASANDRGFGPYGGRGRRPMQETLQLSPEQQKRFDEIMVQSRSRMQALQAENAPKFRAIRAETDARIMAILNDEQKKKFESFVREMDMRMERRRAPRDPGDSGAPPPPGPWPGRQ